MSTADNEKDLERLTRLGLSAMREMRQLRASPTRTLLSSHNNVLEETIVAEEVEEEQPTTTDDTSSSAEVEEPEEEAGDVEPEEDDVEEPEEEAGDVEPEEEPKEEEPQQVQDTLLTALEAAYASNEDMYVDPASIPERARRVRDELEAYQDRDLRAAIFVSHLWTGCFPGMHAYTFRHEVVVDDEYDLDRLLDKDYVWPEVFNNAMMPMAMKLAYGKVDESELARVRGILERGEPLPPHNSLVCYTTDKACRDIKRCRITPNKEVILPGMQDDKPVGFCFKREVLFDILLTQQTPVNPRNREAIPPVLVKSIYDKYRGELLMRAYYLESTPKGRRSG
jgi:hypothetical protein